MAVAPEAELPSPREPVPPYRVCLVCLGNICRSPMAETVLRAELASAGLDGLVVVDSAGTGDWHVGDGMDPGARAALATRGHDGSGPKTHRARQFRPSSLARYDLILAMDARNLRDLRRMARGSAGSFSPGDADRIRLFGEVGGLTGTRGGDIPDPWGGGPDEFGHVLDLLGAAAPVIAGRLARLLRPGSGTGPGDDARRRAR
jgi:protein-tyrosine phosphatase